MQQDNTWTLTDDDSYQHVRKIGDQTYALIETGLIDPERRVYQVYTGDVYLADYSDEEIRSILQRFGYLSMADVVAEYGDAANQIIAECIFEHYGPFAAETIFRGPFYASRCFIDEYIRKEPMIMPAVMNQSDTRLYETVFEIARIAERMENDGAIQVEDSRELFNAVLSWAREFDPQINSDGGNHQYEIESYADSRLRASFPVNEPKALVCRHDNIFFMLPEGVRIKATLCGDAARDQSDNGWSSIDITSAYPDGTSETLCCADYEHEGSGVNMARGKLRIFAYDGKSDEMAYECEDYHLKTEDTRDA